MDTYITNIIHVVLQAKERKIAPDFFIKCYYCEYEGCSIYNETVPKTFTFYEIQRHKYYKH